MKKIIGIVVIIATLTFLVSCGNKIDTGINLDVDLENKIELNTIFPNTGYSDQEMKNGYSANLIEELTGYKVNYRQLSDTNADVDITNFLSSKEELHVMKLSAGQYEAHATNGAFVRLNDLLDKFGKNLKEVISEEAWDSVTDKDGNIFAIPETAFAPMQDNALVFNLSHLKEIGYDKTPETMSEFNDVLYKLQNKFGTNPNYHALGLMGSNSDFSTVSSMFDMPVDFFENDKGEIESFIYSDSFDKYIKYMNGLVKDNVLAASWATNLSSDILSNFTNENISVGYMSYWTIKPLYESMAATSRYETVEDAKKDVAWQLRLRGDGTNGTVNQEKAKYRASIGNAYYMAIPVYMGQTAAYAIDWMDKKITDENYHALYGGLEGEAWEKTSKDTPNAIEINIDNNTEYYKILPGFDKIKGNSMFTTGANIKMGRALWPLREYGFEAWSVLAEEDETLISDPISLRPTLQYWPKVSIVARSYIVTLTQQAINSQREGSKSSEGIVKELRSSFKNQYWTPQISNEIQEWYSDKNK